MQIPHTHTSFSLPLLFWSSISVFSSTNEYIFLTDCLFVCLFVCFFVCLFVCLFVRGFSSHSRIFHSFGDVTITDKELQIFDLCPALMAIEQWGIFNVPRLLWHGPTLYNGHLRGAVTLTPILTVIVIIWHQLKKKIDNILVLKNNFFLRIHRWVNNESTSHNGGVPSLLNVPARFCLLLYKFLKKIFKM